MIRMVQVLSPAAAKGGAMTVANSATINHTWQLAGHGHGLDILEVMPSPDPLRHPAKLPTAPGSPCPATDSACSGHAALSHKLLGRPTFKQRCYVSMYAKAR